MEPALALHQVTHRAVPEAILIAGPTASGKSSAALALAQRLGGAVINADSMQVYRELEMLTARPSKADLAMAPHRLYGMVPASDAYSVGRWLTDMAAATAEARDDGLLPILAGGTGLYFKAALDGLSPIPDITPETRELWRARSEALGADALHRELAARDPVMATRLSATDPQRVARALEVIDATGISLAEWQARAGTPLFAKEAVRKLVVAPEREAIYAAIDARFDRMIENGAIEEVRALVSQQLDPALPAMRAHGVTELAAYLGGAMTLEEAVIKAKTESRRYAKRQMTWAKRFMADWDWVPDAEAAVASALAKP